MIKAERRILIAEDDEADILLLKRAFEEVGFSHKIDFVHDGQEAIDFLTRLCQAKDDRMPVLLVLDLKMPRRTGLEVLQWLRQQPALRCLPAMIFSSSGRGDDIERAYSLGANAFVVKPASTTDRAEVTRFLRAWVEYNQPPLASSEGFRVAQAEHTVRPFTHP
jgi:CheY-like chemotaxis protein